MVCIRMFFFFQAEDGIRDGRVTGVQTCALPISPRDAISRLEQMIGMAGLPMTIASIRGQIAAAIRLIVQLSRLSDGKRKVTSIAEITGLEGDIIQMQEIFKYVRTGLGPDNSVIGHFQATGVRPRFLHELAAMGIKIPGAYFDPSQSL